MLFAFLTWTTLSQAAVTGLGGLNAVAVRPDGKVVAVGGQNRVVYLVDANSLAVVKRIGLSARIGGLAFNPTGSRLVVEDDADNLLLLDPTTGKEVARVTDVAGMVPHLKSGRIAVRDRAERTKARLRLLSLDSLEDKGSIELPDAPAAFTFAGEGKQILVLSKGVLGDEKRVPLRETPAELTGLARAEFQQKHDGYESYLQTFEVGNGKRLRQLKLWYTSDSDSTLLVQTGEITHILNRGNICARISAAGGITLFQTPQRINHGLGVSPNGKYLLTGALDEGTSGPLEGGKTVRFEIPALPGQAEFFNRFAVRVDGAAFGVTTAFRLAKTDREGRLAKVTAVY